MTKQREGKAGGSPKNQLPHYMSRRLTEGAFILALTAGLYLLLSLWTYHITDPSWSHLGYKSGTVANAGGQIGAYLSDSLYFVFGYIAYLIPFSLVYFFWVLLQEQRRLAILHRPAMTLRLSGFSMMICGACGLLSMDGPEASQLIFHNAGGILGESIASTLSSGLNAEGASLLMLAMLLVGVTWTTGLSWIKAIEWLGYSVSRLLQGLFYGAPKLTALISSVPVPSLKRAEKSESPLVIAKPVKVRKERDKVKQPLVVAEEPVAAPKPPAERKVPRPEVSGILPDLNLLDKGQPGKPLGGYTHQELEQVSREVEQHLHDFGIQADVVAVHPGPVITRFELQLAAGIKVSRLTSLAKDLARSLSVTSVRVVEVIPGKTVVGLELPNQHRAVVRLSEVLSAEVYQQAHSPLTVALGVDIAGYPMVVDLAKMPHLLVAGTTGSGKSVGINAMILSLLYKATPEQVRLIMVDPKMLELSVYDGIPHLLTPVVTDMKEAASALRWCVAEMERRYKLMAALGVRNLAGFNARLQEAEAQGEPLTDPLWKPVHSMDESAPLLQKLPYIVVIIDELADMMMVVGKKVEQLIARIAQKARAAGIHLVLATQRPSVDVLTGLIKSNIPTRMSFQVSSKIDSRTILDQQGAEQLLGHGDMLYLAPGSGAPLRVHGAFVDDQEVHRVAEDWRARGEPDYIEEITQIQGEGFDGEGEEGGQDTEDSDPLYDEAVEFVIQSRKASISAVQRRLKIGYNRAARLIEEMERTGVVGPMEGGFRDVLVSSVAED